MRLDSRQLRYFLAIGDAGALSHAAQKLNIAQSALSHHLAEMEAKLGLRLVDRHPRGIRLTPAGERLLAHARSIIDAMARAEKDVATFSEEAAGPVTVGLTYTAARILALPLMRAVRAETPRIILGLIETVCPSLIQSILDETIDLALVFNPQDDARLRIVEILEEDMQVIGSPDLLDPTGGDVAVADLARLPLLLPYPPVALRSVVDDWHIRNQLPGHVMDIASLTALTDALVDGLGCSILATSSVREELRRGALVARRIVEPTLTRRLCLVSLRKHPGTRSFEAIRDILHRLLAAELESGRWEARRLADAAAAG